MANTRKKQDIINSILRRIYTKRKEAATWILGDECIYCGTGKDLQFDHIDTSKKEFTITLYIRWYPWDIIMRELAKCQLLCKKCHNCKTREENGAADHGGWSMYKYHGCRCNTCKDFYSGYMKEYKRKWRLRQGMRPRSQAA